MVNNLIHGLLNLRGLEVYAVVAALCFGEAAILLGFVLPGETAVIIGGVIASQGHVSIVLMIVVVVVAAIVGDTVGYFIGKRFGPVLLTHRPLKGKPAVDKTREFVRRRGGTAVFFGRFTAIFRALVPGIAGMSDVRYRRFLAFNALGGIIWGTGYCIAGYLVGKSYDRLENVASYVSYVILGAAVLFIAYEVRKHVIEHRKHAHGHPPEQETPPQSASGETDDGEVAHEAPANRATAALTVAPAGPVPVGTSPQAGVAYEET
jgi:membrane protein DedA with SNARE-associated domain